MGCDIHTVVQKKDGDVWRDLKKQPEFDRNYTVFTVLAGVKRRDNALPIIAEPRGLPSDFDYAEDVQEWPHLHTLSWLLLSEILAYDWQQTLYVKGWVDAANFRLWDLGELPKEWFKSVSGSVVHCSHDEMRYRLKQPISPEIKDSPHALVEWTVPVGDYCQQFLGIVKSLKAMGDPKCIRLVFWFDN